MSSFNRWGGTARVGTVLKITKKQKLGDFKVKKGYYVVAVEQAGDWYFNWLVVGFNFDLRIEPLGMHGDYWIEGEELGKITKSSLYSLLNALHNPPCQLPHVTISITD